MNSQNLLRHGAKEKMQNLKNKKNSLVKSIYSLKANRKSFFFFIFFGRFAHVQGLKCS